MPSHQWAVAENQIELGCCGARFSPGAQYNIVPPPLTLAKDLQTRNRYERHANLLSELTTRAVMWSHMLKVHLTVCARHRVQF